MSRTSAAMTSVTTAVTTQPVAMAGAVVVVGVVVAGIVWAVGRLWKRAPHVEDVVDDLVDLASDGSFPASDPPAWNSARA